MGPYCVWLAVVLVSDSLFRRIRGNPDRKRQGYSLLMALLLTLLLGLRHPSMGIDLGYGMPYGYLPSFRELSGLPWKTLLSLESYQNYERGYLLFNKLVGCICRDSRFFLLCCAAAAVLPVGSVIGKHSADCRTSFLIWFGLTVFQIPFSGLRQAIAVAVTFRGVSYVKERRLLPYLAVVALAVLFHRTAVVAVLVYPLYGLRPDRTARLVSIGLLPLLFLLRSRLWNRIIQLVGRGTPVMHSGDVGLFLLFCAVYCYLVLFAPEKSRLDGPINIQYLSCCILIFTEVSTVALRMGYYTMLYLTLTLPELLQQIRKKSGYREYTLHLWAVTGGFVLCGFYNLLHSAWAGAYPYYFFWESIPLW